MTAVTEVRDDELLPAEEFSRRVFELHDEESASRGPFMRAFAAGEMPREALRRWSMEWYHYNMWMCPPFVASAQTYQGSTPTALFTRIDNIMGEIGYKQWKAHPYLAADLALELGATWEEIENYIPLPTTIFYMRSLLGALPTISGASSNIVEVDNQRCSGMIHDALRTHYGVSDDGARYFEVHRESDMEHTEELLVVLNQTCDTRQKQEDALRLGRQALRKRCLCFNGWLKLWQN